MKILHRFFILLLLISQSVGACPQFEIPLSLVQSVEKILGVTTPWKGFEIDSLGFVFGGKENAFLFGFPSNEVFKVFPNAVPCETYSGWFAINLPFTKPQNGLYEPISPRSDGTPLQRLAFVHGKKILFTLIRPDIPNAFFSDEDIARVSLHEQFHHTYQFEKKFIIEEAKTFPRNYLDQCSKYVQWTANVRRELDTWTRLLKGWDSISNDDLKKEVLNIITDRYKNISSDHLYCWSATRFWERLEGTAYYVEGEAALRASFKTEQEFNFDTVKYLLPSSTVISTGPASSVSQINPSFFYAIGGVFLRTLQRIQPNSNFESLIESGYSPEEAFSQLVKH